ncbi:FAD-dependent oxidoreductase [Streptomyces vilmorinianum]|uniref:FAD-dependent oxidoreductase n=1 Tax=Streptomyces vilmorinianum TaxID=3051092 RepID=UPI0010FB6379|nr:FAD-dependent monooxygenase [Streptomyces vilmorinianum]
MSRGVPRRVAETAVVVGASMAGLCAARVLSERFDQVVVIDRDPLPDEPRRRPHVPQGRQPHLLLYAGAELLEGWFPGIVKQLYDGGATEFDVCRDFYWHQSGGVLTRPESELRGPAMSRPLLETTVRERLAALPSVTLRDRTTVEGLEADATGTRITGVRLAGQPTLGCDLMVDATGRQARSLGWLRELGFPEPPLSVVTVDTHYASRIYRRDEATAPDWKAAAVIGDPATRRLAMALPLEGARWIVALVGINGEVPPTDEAERVAFARSLGSPVIADLMAACEPLTEPVAYRFASNQRRHVERLRRFPVGWVPAGDAVSSFNPIYGQGMTSAAQQATVLGACLDHTGRVDRHFARRYFRAAARTVAVPWSIAVGGDFAYAGTTGKKPPGTDVLNRYVDRVTRAAQHDDTVTRRFNEVAGLARRPEWLLAPAFVLRVLRSGR